MELAAGHFRASANAYAQRHEWRVRAEKDVGFRAGALGGSGPVQVHGGERGQNVQRRSPGGRFCSPGSMRAPRYPHRRAGRDRWWPRGGPGLHTSRSERGQCPCCTPARGMGRWDSISAACVRRPPITTQPSQQPNDHNSSTTYQPAPARTLDGHRLRRKLCLHSGERGRQWEKWRV
jgi:hypothetical protein